MRKRWNQAMRTYLQQHLTAYIFVSVLFLMGVAFGALLLNALTLEQKREMTWFIEHFFQTLDGEDHGVFITFRDTFALHMKWLLLIWILGLSVIGLPFILVLDFLKGILVGFTIGYLIGQLSWRGALFALASVAPQNLIVIPVLLVASVSAISFSFFIVRNRFLQRRGSLAKAFYRYGNTALVLAFLLVLVSVFEASVTPAVMERLTPWLMRAS